MKHEAEILERHHKLSRNVSIILGILSVVIVLVLIGFALLYISYRTSVDNYMSIIALNKKETDSSLVKGLVLPRSTSNIIKPLNSQNLVSIVAQNQPAVVRILTVRCADVVLRLDSSIEARNVCIAGVGSGSIISSDGYISTNGHVVVLSDNSLVTQSISSMSEYSQILKYLYSKQVITVGEANSYLGALADADKSQNAETAITKLIPSSQISITNQETSYAVQLSNEPIRLDTNQDRIIVGLSDSIKEAKLIDRDFNLESSELSLAQGSGFSSSDVALLKIDGEYPYINLGALDGLNSGDQLIAIGFPAFVDGSVDTSQWQTVPSVTRGIIKKISSDSVNSNRKLVLSDVQVAQGSSGGPALDSNGYQIGLNTYANIECADLMCFGDATIRDIADIKSLLARNNIVLKKDSDINEHWYSSLKSYNEGDLVSALRGFEWIEGHYPNNYLATSLAVTARDQIGGSADISPRFALLSNIYQLAIIILSVFVSLVAISISLIRYINIRHRRLLVQFENENISN